MKVSILGLRVSEAIVKVLEDVGVTYVFGVPGSSTVPIYDALYSSKIKHILTRHEQSASYMADAYAKVTGRMGVCDASIGPGGTNLTTGVATAWTDGSPVLALTGQVSLSKIGKGAFQELDIVSMFKPIVKSTSRLVDPNSVFKLMSRLISLAVSNRPGPVHIEVPYDVQTSVVDSKIKNGPLLERKSVEHNPERVMEVLSYLYNAKRPIIIAGGGCHYSREGASREIISLAEYLNIPVVSTFNGRGTIPDDHPLSIGRMGVRSKDYIDKVLGETDVILAVGCRFAELSTRHWTAIKESSSTIIRVDIDATQIGRIYPHEVGIVGYAKEVLQSLLEGAKTTDYHGSWISWVQGIQEAKREWWGRHKPIMTAKHIPLKPQSVCYAIRKSFERDTIFTLDAGNHKMWASTFLDIYEPRTWIQSGGFGHMGYALPAAIACKLAKPKRDVVAICGDGGFLMTMEEMATVNREGIPIILCIFDDSALGLIKHQQQLTYDGRFISVDLTNPDFVKLAEAFDWHGERVERPNQIAEALLNAQKRARTGTSSLIDFAIDETELLPP